MYGYRESGWRNARLHLSHFIAKWCYIAETNDKNRIIIAWKPYENQNKTNKQMKEEKKTPNTFYHDSFRANH